MKRSKIYRTICLKYTDLQLFKPVIADPLYYDLQNDSVSLSDKEIIMLDEHHHNKELADAIKNNNRKYFDYEVWDTTILSPTKGFH